MATTANTAIATLVKSTNSAIQTYLVSTQGMSPELLTLVQQAVATTTFDKKGQPYKSFDSEGNFIFVTGFCYTQQVQLSIGTNQKGLPCLNFDDILTAEDKRAIVMARRVEKSTAPATPAVAPATPIAPATPVDANNVQL